MEFLQPLPCQRSGDGAHTLEPSGNTRFVFQVAVKLLTVLGELGHIRRRTQLGNQACGVPCGAGGELLAFEQHDVFPTKLGQVVGN